MRNVLPRMLTVLEARVPRSAPQVRFGVIHVGADDIATAAKVQLQQLYPTAEIIVAPATPVLAAHLGPGAWGLCYIQ